MKRFKNWLPAILVMSAIFFVSSIPGKTADAYHLNKESLHIGWHFSLFVFLFITYFKATKNILISILYGIGYAFLDEFHQGFTPERSVSTFDIFVDTMGVLISAGLLWKLLPILPKKLKSWLEN